MSNDHGNNTGATGAIRITDITNKLIWISVEVSCLSGTVTRDDQRSEDEKKVFTAGSVRYIRKSALDPFTAARQAVARACRTRGSRLLGGWAVPEDEIPALEGDLEKIAAFVNQHKEPVIQNWSKELADWEAIYPVAGEYRSRFPSAAAASKGIGIAISALRINPTPVNIKGASDSTTDQVLSMPMRILHEIAADIQDSWRPGGTKAKESIKGLLQRIANKCRTLSFVGGNLAEVANFVEAAIARLPRSGDITGNDFLILSGILSLLERPEIVAMGNLSIHLPEPVIVTPADSKIGPPEEVVKTIPKVRAKKATKADAADPVDGDSVDVKASEMVTDVAVEIQVNTPEVVSEVIADDVQDESPAKAFILPVPTALETNAGFSW